MSLFNRLLVVPLVCLASSISHASVEKITWYVNDAPPFYIFDGSHKGQGICDVITDSLIASLPGVQHEKLELPHSRITVSLSQGNKACFPCMIHRTQNSDESIYSKPQMIYPPHRLIVRPGLKQKLIDLFGDPVDLDALLTSEDYIFTYHGGRMFDDTLQSLLDEKLLRRNELILRNQGGSTTSIFEILQLGRADYTIEYSAIAQYYNSEQETPLDILSIKQNAEKLVFGAVGCSTAAPDNFGIEATNAINTAMNGLTTSPEFITNVSKWFDISPEKYRQWMEAHIQPHYREKPGP